ncbi:MAG: D-alanine--D-alanine ligase [Flavobacteriaceae bacterium]|nr:D-alanine--D-alanine ligase [Flavobacteriaceae bacterium]
MKKNIAVVMGGYSSEVKISMLSGQVVVTNLDVTKYHIYTIHILKNKWVAVVDSQEIPINKNDFSITIHHKKIIFDCIFNAIHGNPGENGKLIAYFELLNIRHTSASFYQMALTFNKRDTLSVLKEYAVKCAKSIYINKGDKIDLDNIISSLKLPCFVKPNNAGSSYGISKVHQKENLQKAIDYAFTEDTEILIESFLNGKEVSVGVTKFNNEIVVLPMTEIISENDFFDYEAKYKGKSQEITPARISKEEHKKLHKTATKIYKILNLKGITRSDFILVNGEPHFIEINTVPGLSIESIVPQQIREAGYSLQAFFGLAIENCF